MHQTASCLQKLRDLIERCWHHEIHSRPDFMEVISVLEGLLEQLGPRKAVADAGTPHGGCCTVQ